MPLLPLDLLLRAEGLRPQRVGQLRALLLRDGQVHGDGQGLAEDGLGDSKKKICVSSLGHIGLVRELAKKASNNIFDKYTIEP